MATFIYRIDQKTCQLSDLPNDQLKDQFESLKTIVDNQLGALRCQTHNFEPIINLESDGKQAMISGLGGCCKELTSKAVELIRAAGIDTKDWKQVTVRKERIF